MQKYMYEHLVELIRVSAQFSSFRPSARDAWQPLERDVFLARSSRNIAVGRVYLSL